MKFETKFNQEDEIFFIENKKCCSSIVRGIKIEILPGHTAVTYLCNKDGDAQVRIKVDESDAFKTKEALLKSL